MAILARPSHRILREGPGALSMAKTVTIEAQPRTREFQRVFVDGAVSVVAYEAVLAHRLVLEQERAALLGGALVASIVDRIFLQQRLGEAAVRIMTVRADHLALAHGHMRRAKHLRAPVLVALEAGGRLERGFQLVLPRHCLHDGVAVGARHPLRLVRASGPIYSRAALVTAE